MTVMDDDPVGTVTEQWSSAAPYPRTSSTVRKRYPDGTVRQWSRPSSTAAWVEEDVVDHTSGGQRAAEVEATAEQRAEWERRRRARADELVRELRNLGIAASAHTGAAEHIAHAARLAAETLARGGQAYDDEARREVPSLVTSRDAPPPGATLVHGRGDQPPFAADLVVERPPHEQ